MIFNAYANPATPQKQRKNNMAAKPLKNDVDYRWFHFVDIMTAHGCHLTRRDAVRIGRKLEIEIFKNYHIGVPFKEPTYEYPDGTLRKEKFPDFAFSWWTQQHQDCVIKLTHNYLTDERFNNVAYNLALHFITCADDKHCRNMLLFASNWFSNAIHISLLKRADALAAMEQLRLRGIIESVSKTISAYKFKNEYFKDVKPRIAYASIVRTSETGSNTVLHESPT